MIPTDARPSPRDIFLRASKRLEVFFHTSNQEKYLQARAVCRAFGLDLKHFKTHTEPYREDYSAGKRALLERAIEEMQEIVGRSSIFFVEDTSLRIDALSAPDLDFPGLAVKEWFATTSFESLDAALQARGASRKAAVKSDIALHIPGLKRPIFFSGETEGEVATTAPDFEASPQHPWLTPLTFNGWFVPHDSDKRLGAMSFEESWQYDFRIRALTQLIERLEEYATILNVGTHGYTRPLKRATVSGPRLFVTEKPSLIVVGRTCAGKTTFGEYADLDFGCRHIDASSVMRSFQSEYGSPDLPADEFAKKVIEDQGADVVARKILDLYGSEVEDGLIITGFRTIEELETIKSRVGNVKVVFVDASPRVRFDRHLLRGRNPKCRNYDDFVEHDQRQWRFGLLRVAEDFADIKIVNEGTYDDYMAQARAVLSGSSLAGVRGITTGVLPRSEMDRDQLYRCLSVICEANRPLTCKEVAEALKERGSTMRTNNIAKTLRAVPELAKERRISPHRVRYEIESAGRAYVRLVQSRGYGAR